MVNYAECVQRISVGRGQVKTRGEFRKLRIALVLGTFVSGECSTAEMTLHHRVQLAGQLWTPVGKMSHRVICIKNSCNRQIVFHL